MLVLNRKIGQQVLICNGLILVKVLNVNEETITLGFHAPQDINIDREEIYWKKGHQSMPVASLTHYQTQRR